MSDGQLLSLLLVAVGWAVTVTTFTAKLVLNGSLVHSRELTTCKTTLTESIAARDALRTQLDAVSSQSLTTAQQIASVNAAEAAELRQTIAELIAKLPKQEVRT